jgi:hypothetical protein
MDKKIITVSRQDDDCLIEFNGSLFAISRAIIAIMIQFAQMAQDNGLGHMSQDEIISQLFKLRKGFNEFNEKGELQ